MAGSFSPRKRDRLRGVLGLQKKSLPSQTPPVSPIVTPSPQQTSSTLTVSTVQNPAAVNPSQRFLEAALNKLSPKEQETIRIHLSPDSQDIKLAIDQAYNAALSKKKACESNKWRFTIGPKEFVLRDEADKVVRWLERFKGVGNVIANVDPLHVGLPWACIRAILEVRLYLLRTKQLRFILTIF